MDESRFPLFVRLTGKKAVVIGGGKVALRRGAVLREFGAEVTVIAPAMESLLEGAQLLFRPYAPGDLEGAWLAVAATDDPEVNAAVGREARAGGVLFNRADDRTDCDFFFPAICRGGALVAGLVGDGTDHRKVASAAREVRRILEEMK
ncbi:MAG: NAD(P)-dependent oxidoreductase [Eubacteriales bacterium]|nr:NAD(P)-dependent oxidoreductase [Eubacteriales bacterium]